MVGGVIHSQHSFVVILFGTFDNCKKTIRVVLKRVIIKGKPLKEGVKTLEKHVVYNNKDIGSLSKIN